MVIYRYISDINVLCNIHCKHMSLLNVEPYFLINVFYVVLFCIHVCVDDVIRIECLKNMKLCLESRSWCKYGSISIEHTLIAKDWIYTHDSTTKTFKQLFLTPFVVFKTSSNLHENRRGCVWNMLNNEV